ncbi:MAG: hypothetical protein RLZZ41_216 [Actinomycetota bacterium]
MTKTRALSLWVLSLVLLSITAGQSWASFEVSEDVGGGFLQVTGFEAFPVIATLLSVQVVAVVVSLLVRPIVTMVLSLGIALLMIWNLFDVFLHVISQVRLTFSTALANKTGVLTDPANSDFLIGSLITNLHWAYLVAVVANLAILLFVASTVSVWRPKQRKRTNTDLPEDLWSSQK